MQKFFEEFLEKSISPVRQGSKLKFRCELCRKLRQSYDEAIDHIMDDHQEAVKEAMEAREVD